MTHSRVSITFSEAVDGDEETVCGASSKSKNACRLAIDLASTIERCGHPRPLQLLAEAIHIIGTLPDDDQPALTAAHASLVDAASRVVLTWDKHDREGMQQTWRVEVVHDTNDPVRWCVRSGDEYGIGIGDYATHGEASKAAARRNKKHGVAYWRASVKQ